MTLFIWVISSIGVILILFIWRILRTRGLITQKRPKNAQNIALIVLGSGGHTMEMFKLMNGVCERFNKRIYVTADELSKQKVKNMGKLINRM